YQILWLASRGTQQAAGLFSVPLLWLLPTGFAPRSGRRARGEVLATPRRGVVSTSPLANRAWPCEHDENGKALTGSPTYGNVCRACLLTFSRGLANGLEL